MPQPLENLPSYEELGPIDLTFLDSPAATSESEFSFATNEGSSDDSSEDAPCKFSYIYYHQITELH